MTYTGLADGAHGVAVVATDQGGFTGPAFTTWFVDATPPVVNLYTTPDPVTSDTAVKFAWNSDTPGATYTCALDGGAARTCESPEFYSGLPDGTHLFVLSGQDPAGNVTVLPTETWVQDTVNPLLTVTGGPPEFTNLKSWTWSLAADETVNYRCSKDLHPFHPVREPLHLDRDDAGPPYPFGVPPPRTPRPCPPGRPATVLGRSGWCGPRDAS